MLSARRSHLSEGVSGFEVLAVDVSYYLIVVHVTTSQYVEERDTSRFIDPHRSSDTTNMENDENMMSSCDQ